MNKCRRNAWLGILSTMNTVDMISSNLVVFICMPLVLLPPLTLRTVPFARDLLVHGLISILVNPLWLDSSDAVLVPMLILLLDLTPTL